MLAKDFPARSDYLAANAACGATEESGRFARRVMVGERLEADVRLVRQERRIASPASPRLVSIGHDL